MKLFALGPTSQTDPGTPIGLGCQGCEFRDPCGGTTDFDCFANCCGRPSQCTTACPRSHNFVAVLRDSGGFEIKRNWNIRQGPDDLPAYIPHIKNGSGRIHSLAWPYVALTTFDVAAPDSERVFAGPGELRRHFRISDNAQVLLLSVGKDNRLERHWKYAESRRLVEYLASLGISHITAPNFSFPLDVPRPEHLVNRSRSLNQAERFAAAGLSVIPHVNAFNQTDWDNWRDFLRTHPHLSIVSQEFQTGLASRRRACWHVWQLCNLEQSLGRGLRLLAIGGRRHLSLLVGLSSVTIADCVPFLRTCKRRRLDMSTGKWLVHRTGQGESLDHLLEQNIATYSDHVQARVSILRQIGPLLPELELASVEESSDAHYVSELQLSLWRDPVAAR